MKRTIIVIIYIIVSLTGCNQVDKSNNKLNTPDVVEIKKDVIHYQFPGTRVFIVAPTGFKPFPSLITIYKDNENTSIRCLELQANFTKQKFSMRKGIEYLQSKGFKLYYEKEFKLGDFEALLFYGSNSNPILANIFLVYGDSSFTVILESTFLRNDETSRDEMLSALLTCYLDKSAKPDYSDLTHFTIDLSKSKFKLQSNMSQMFIYTIDGKGDNQDDILFKNQILMYSFPPLKPFEKVIDQSESLVDKIKSNGVVVSSIQYKFIKINGAEACITTYDGFHGGHSLKCYQVALGDDKGTVIFVGQAYEQQIETIQQFKEIAQTLKTK